MSPGDSWRPLLVGDDAARAREAISAIASDLARSPSPGPALDGGAAGAALLDSYLWLDGDDAAGERAADAIARAVDGLGEVDAPQLLEGFSGVAWTVAHLAPHLELETTLLDELDHVVAPVALRRDWPHEWEYLNGLVGVGVYPLERASELADEMLARLVGHLAARAERTDAGITWRSPPWMLDGMDPRIRERHRDGYYNLGLAHGVVGVAAFLTAATRRDVAGARELLEGCVRWILRHDSGDAHGRMPKYVLDGPPAMRRDGWCYGDPSTAVVLLGAAAATGEEAWRHRALDLARSVVGRAPAEPLDAAFCHGTLGRAHIFNRLAQATGDAELAGVARAWYRETLDLRRPGAGVGGFACDETPARATSILVGATGIALGLTAAVSPVEPGWDRALLLSHPA